MKERRLVRVAVSFDLLRDMMDQGYRTPGAIKAVRGLPSDAVMTSDGFDVARQEAWLFFYHESFDVVPDGETIPVKQITHQIDYTLVTLLERWLEGIEYLRIRNDAVLDAIVGKELDGVFQDTVTYLDK